MVDVALVKDGRVVNVAAFDDTVWDFDAWAAFEAAHDELVTVAYDGEGRPSPWIGWTRPGPGEPFAPPPDPSILQLGG